MCSLADRLEVLDEAIRGGNLDYLTEARLSQQAFRLLVVQWRRMTDGVGVTGDTHTTDKGGDFVDELAAQRQKRITDTQSG